MALSSGVDVELLDALLADRGMIFGLRSVNMCQGCSLDFGKTVKATYFNHGDLFVRGEKEVAFVR
jgi:hypothetical protein